MHPNSSKRGAPQAGNLAAARIAPIKVRAGTYTDADLRAEVPILRDLREDIAAGKASPRDLAAFRRMRQALKDRTRGRLVSQAIDRLRERLVEHRHGRKVMSADERRIALGTITSLRKAVDGLSRGAAVQGVINKANIMSQRFSSRPFLHVQDGLGGRFRPVREASAASLKRELHHQLDNAHLFL